MSDNLSPRFTRFVDAGGRIATNWRAFFTRAPYRRGRGIASFGSTPSLPQIVPVANALIQEFRAQGWIETGEGIDADKERDLTGSPTFNVADAITSICLIPATTEWGYDPKAVFNIDVRFGIPLDQIWYPRNTIEYSNSTDKLDTWGIPEQTISTGSGPIVYTDPSSVYRDDRDAYRESAPTDWALSLDNAQAQIRNLKYVSLFVSWFGDDLRCGSCTVRPKVESKDRDDDEPTYPYIWRAGGLDRATALEITQLINGAAYGSTPADRSVVAAIRDLKDRGIGVVYTPFLLMDIASTNTLPDPYSDNAATTGQPVFPWRGRITCSPAAGYAGTVDKTSGAAAQISAFVGTAGPDDFYAVGDEVFYSGAAEWSYRRFVLHQAHLCALAGGVDTFVIGSEQRGLTWVRGAGNSFPFVQALREIAADVKTILPGAKITYAADWSEYFGYQPTDGSGDIFFGLDALWADDNIDAIGIDNYFPLADWRDGTTHLDYLAGFETIYDIDYLQGNQEGGERYDFFYASEADRDAQIRTPITDGAYGKPWIYRPKDLKNWWQNRHYNRIAGIEQSEPTEWVPESKPFWYMEIGCPSVDKGSNQPNVFVDPKSSESFFPYYSSQAVDGFIQRLHNHAILRYYNPDDPRFTEDRNPKSSVYDGRMLDPDRIFIYTWDARPYPTFPVLSQFFGDAANWETGQWVTGKLPPSGGASVPDSVYTSDQEVTILAPRNPFIIDPRTQQLDRQWRDFFDSIGFVEGDAIPDLTEDATADEIAQTINSLLAVLRFQQRI